MTAFQQLQNSFNKNLATPQVTQPVQPQVDYRKQALAQNKQNVLNQLSQGPQGGME